MHALTWYIHTPKCNIVHASLRKPQQPHNEEEEGEEEEDDDDDKMERAEKKSRKTSHYTHAHTCSRTGRFTPTNSKLF
jgi:hypothetical protein